MPWRVVLIASTLGLLGGAVFGFVRGLYYLPTLPFAIIEGGILCGVPMTVIGLLIGGIWSLGRVIRRRFS